MAEVYDFLTALATSVDIEHLLQHVGVRRYSQFLAEVYDLLEDDGVFVFQVAGIRPSWQYEDLIW